MNKSLKLGRYRHFKGNEYEVIAIGRHSETLEEMVVYKALYESDDFGKGAVWIRPLAMFSDTVSKDGVDVSRFTFIG